MSATRIDKELELEERLRAFTMRVFNPEYDGNPLAEMIAYITSMQHQLLDELIESEEMYHDEGTLQPVMAIPVRVLEKKRATLQGEEK